jgi:uncharacterized damage-inducible protein DinB
MRYFYNMSPVSLIARQGLVLLSHTTIMKELLTLYAEYNIWSNKLIIDAVLKLNAGEADKEIISSFPSIKLTVYHLWSAEYIWLQRLQLAEHPVWIAAGFNGTLEEACKEWQNVSVALEQFTKRQYDDNAMRHVLQYYDMKKTSHKTPVFQVLHHVFNHATYHHGQLVTMLRQTGQTKIPQTDFITFVRQR